MPMSRKKNKNPPVLSHEFVIQNHADIVSCIAIILMVGLMFEGTSPLSKLFIFLQYGVSEEELGDGEVTGKFPMEFRRGLLDALTILFQSLIIIVIHAVIQEYGIDKVSKKLHLSKSKTSKFSESGQLSVWSAVSTVWAGYCLYQSDILINISSLWDGYPHIIMNWEKKLFMLVQIAYWIHMFPELYLQKIRREDIPARMQYYFLYLIFITVAYTTHLWKFCIVALMLHYTMEFIFHVSRMLYFAEKDVKAQIGFQIWALGYPLVRFLSLSLGVLVFWIGLRNAPAQGLDIKGGNFNNSIVRAVCMSGVCVLQMWLFWKYLRLRSRRRKELKPFNVQGNQRKSVTKSKGSKNKQKRGADLEESSKAKNGKLKKC